MLNSNGERELAYVVKVDSIEPITGSDNCESANVGGWHIMVRKGTFVPGDPAIYFEIDSHVDTSKPEFAFLEKRHGNIKTQKYTFGGKGSFVSQGLLMAPADFGWGIGKTYNENREEVPCITADDKVYYVGDFLTKELGVTYASYEDNARKSNNPDAQLNMAKDKYKKFLRTKLGKWLMRFKWFRKLIIAMTPGARKSKWPAWVIKTDEERCQNLPRLFPGNKTEKWIATEKIDGTSCTFTYRKRAIKHEFYYCSRNVCFGSDYRKEGPYANIYEEMASMYNMKDVCRSSFSLARALYGKRVEYVTIQAEAYGGGVQKRDYNIKHHDMAVFNIIIGFNDGECIRLNPLEGQEWAEELMNIPYVPIVDPEFIIPETCDEMLEIAGGTSKIDGGMREGLVIRDMRGIRSFKAVDNNFIIRYHGG